MLTDIQEELFWDEVNLIQKRHSLFFPVDQIKNIILSQTGTDHCLAFIEDHQIPAAIIFASIATNVNAQSKDAEKYSKQSLLRPIVIQDHIDPVPGFIVKQIMRTLKLTTKDMEKILSEI